MGKVSLRPPRVLHVVETLGRGATEIWLLRMLAHAQKCGIALDWTFYCALPDPGLEAANARALGAKVICSPVPVGEKIAFMRALRREVGGGTYDVFHSHHDLVSGFYLAAIIGVQLRRRIVHLHNSSQGIPSNSRVKEFFYKPVLRAATLVLADQIVGVSESTLDTFLRERPRRPGRDTVRYCGVDASPFEGPEPDKRQFRRSLGLSEDSNIMLFAGRMVPEKNPGFVLKVLQEMRRDDARSVAVFAGSGSEEQAVANEAKKLGLESHVRLLGWREDVACIMRASDWFILPSPEWPMEGFGLAVLEAQLAGLRLLLSPGIPQDPLLKTAVFRRHSLAESPAHWSRSALQMLRKPAPSPAAALRALHQSPMDMQNAFEAQLELYL